MKLTFSLLLLNYAASASDCNFLPNSDFEIQYKISYRTKKITSYDEFTVRLDTSVFDGDYEECLEEGDLHLMELRDGQWIELDEDYKDKTTVLEWRKVPNLRACQEKTFAIQYKDQMIEKTLPAVSIEELTNLKYEEVSIDKIEYDHNDQKIKWDKLCSTHSFVEFKGNWSDTTDDFLSVESEEFCKEYHLTFHPHFNDHEAHAVDFQFTKLPSHEDIIEQGFVTVLNATTNSVQLIVDTQVFTCITSCKIKIFTENAQQQFEKIAFNGDTKDHKSQVLVTFDNLEHYTEYFVAVETESDGAKSEFNLEAFTTQFDKSSLSVEVIQDEECCTGQVSLIGDLPEEFTILEFLRVYNNRPTLISKDDGARSVDVEEIPCIEVTYEAQLINENTREKFYIKSQPTEFKLDIMNDFKTNFEKFAKPSVARGSGKIRVEMHQVHCVPYDIVARVKNDPKYREDGDERLLTVDYDDVWQTVVAEIDDWLPCEDLEVSFRPSSMDGSEVPELSFQLESLLPLDDVTVHAEIDEINVPGVIGFTIENQTCAKHYELSVVDGNDNEPFYVELENTDNLKVYEVLSNFTPCKEYTAKMSARTEYGKIKHTQKYIGAITPVGEVKADWTELAEKLNFSPEADYDFDLRSVLGATDSKRISWTHSDSCIESYQVKFTGNNQDFSSQINVRPGEEAKLDLSTLEQCQNYNLEIVPNFKEVTLFSGNFVSETFQKEILIKDEYNCVPQTTTPKPTEKAKQPRAAQIKEVLLSTKSGSDSILSIKNINVIVNLVLSTIVFSRLI